ncbi:Butyrophilin-like protein 2, partial [Sciurus carolinensis]|nr:Butyrophilin-like protein 2 [Sciurus carolinensis]
LHFHLFIVFCLLYLTASLKVIGPSQPILVRVGEDIQLTCYLFPKANAQSMEVRWVQAHHYPAVYVYMNGDHVAREQMVDYRGRTALMSDAIHEGRLTLQIRNARTSDDGQYQCLFEKDGVYQKASLDLKVVAVGSSPRITMEVLTDGEIQLMCTSNGWFPQPQMQWRDMEGKTIPSISEILHSDSHGLFHVETSLLIPNSSMANVTCSISNLPLGEEKKAAFTLSECSPHAHAQISPAMLVLQNGQEQSGEQMLEYQGRIKLVGESISKGDMALLIQHMKASDNGQYWCHFKDGNISQEAFMELNVIGLGSSPHVHMTGPKEGGIQMLCSSGGWFQKPKSEPFFPRMSPWKAALAGTVLVLGLLFIGINYIGWKKNQAKEREIKKREKESHEEQQMRNEKEVSLKARDWKKALIYPDEEDGIHDIGCSS